MGAVGLLTALSAISSIVGGAQQSREASSQAAATRAEASRQAGLVQQESELAARKEVRANIKFEKRQKLAFLKSGVALEGSPLLVLAETEDEGEENVEAILTSGRTRAGSILGSGASQASRLKSSGRSALIGGLTGGLSAASPLLKKK